MFRLLCCSESVAIASREAVPAEFGLARDPRSLGVALRHVSVCQGSVIETIKAEDPRLTDGFHDYEVTDHLRWTNGYAHLPAELLARFTGGEVEIVLTLAGATRYPDLGEPRRRVAA